MDTGTKQIDGISPTPSIVTACVHAVPVAALVGASLFVVPGLRGLFEEAGASLPWPTRLALAVSDSLVRYWFLFLPLVAALMLSTVFIQASPIPDILRSSWVYLHTSLMFLAYGMFFGTFIAGLFYLLQERELKSKKPRTFYDQLPSLRALDELFLKFLIAGFTFMSFGLIVGVIWAEQQWVNGWFKDPKVLAAMTTWGIYLALLYVRLTLGWRGRRVALLGMLGFCSVLFTFLGVAFFGGQHVFG